HLALTYYIFKRPRQGELLYNGEFVAKNSKEAFKLLSKAAEQEHASAQYNFGVMFCNMKCLNQAPEWFSNAAEQGVPEAQYELGVMYLLGNEFVSKNPLEPLVWFARAAEQGYPPAQNNYYSHLFREKHVVSPIEMGISSSNIVKQDAFLGEDDYTLDKDVLSNDTWQEFFPFS
ncbi:MAG: sel1 repeat family protein, partial [Puniceicoccales bacterium]|nr:sel1 repeat family protein [Puniceicoccales bacterium]